MQIPFDKDAFILLVLKKIQNKINWLGYNTKISPFNSIKNPHRMCFPSSCLSIYKICSIIAIQYINDKRFASNIKNFSLSSIFIKNLIKFEFSRYLFGNFQINKLLILWICKSAPPDILMLGSWIKYRIILFFIERWSYSYKNLHIFLTQWSFLVVVIFIIAW